MTKNDSGTKPTRVCRRSMKSWLMTPNGDGRP